MARAGRLCLLGPSDEDVVKPIGVQIRRREGCGDLPLPARQTAHSAGFDLAAAVDAPITIQSGQILLVACGFYMALPEGYEAQVRPRSGLASRHGITLVNSPGTIDADYRGEVMVPLINLSKIPFVIERGMRIAQMVISKLPDVEMVEVEKLDETKRGKGGFGHTGH